MNFDKITRKIACVVDIAMGILMFLLAYGMWAAWFKPITVFWSTSTNMDIVVILIVLGVVGTIASIWMGFDFIRSGIRRYKKERSKK